MITALIYERGELRSSTDPKEIEIAIHHRGTRIWVDLFEPTAEEYRLLSKVFKFHHLVIEDTKKFTGVPKIENHDDYLFIIFHRLSQKKEALNVEEMDLFLGNKYLVTVHRNRVSTSVQKLRENIKENPKLMLDTAMVLHGLLDVIVDNYIELLDKWETRAQHLENQLVKGGAEQEDVQKLLQMRRRASKLRRTALAEHEIVTRLERGESKLLSKKSKPYFRDVKDHLVTVNNVLDNVKDTIQGAFDAYISVSNQRMNEIMYKLTIVASIFIPLTFITGVYGMNFRWMPYLLHPHGFWLIAASMGIIAVLFYVWLRKQNRR